MMWEKLENFSTVAIGMLEGVYGWINEAIALAIFVLIFNFFIKWALRKLHQHLEKKKKIWTDSFVQSLYSPLSYYVWFFAGVHAFDIISSKVFQSPLLKYEQMILSVGLIFSSAWFLFRWKRKIINALITRSKTHQLAIDHGKLDVIDKVLTVVIIFATLLLVLDVTNRNVSTIIAFGGVGGLAIAFASQEVISNFFGGLMIYLTHPFVIGDWINLPEHGIEGHVEEIGWYTTRIRSLEKRPIYIPNSMFSKVVVMTPSRMSHRQFKETIGLRYADMPVLKEIIKDLKQMLNESPNVDQSLNKLVYLTSFGSYSIDISISAYFLTINALEYAESKQDLLFKIYDIVKKYGAEMACPTTQISLEGRHGKLNLAN